MQNGPAPTLAPIAKRLAPQFLGAEPDSMSRSQAVREVVRLLDLTSLSPADDETSIERLCARARHPVSEPGLQVGGVCVRPSLVAVAARQLSGCDIRTVAVAGNFPSGVATPASKALEAEKAVAEGAQEIDLIINWRACLAGNERGLLAEVAAVRRTIGPAITLKVILEASEFPDLARLERAARGAIGAGADFLKTSSGVLAGGATREAVLLFCLLAKEARAAGIRVGVKPSGGVRTVEQALEYLSIAETVLGPQLSRADFRFGASGLLDRLVAEIEEAPVN